MKRLMAVLFSFLFVSSAHAETSSFAQLLAAGQPVECEFAKSDGSQNGTIFVSGEKLRGEITTNQNGTESLMHMIRDTEKMYSWGGPMGETQGVIMPANMQGTGMMGSSQMASMQESMDFSCKPWSADASQFDPPSDVTFQDMGQMMGALAGAQSGNTQ